MRGYNTFVFDQGWICGDFDATALVVRELAEQGIDYRTLGREEFIRRVLEVEGRERREDHTADEADRE